MRQTDRLFFLHVPKTGGTTFTRSLCARFGPLGYLREVVLEPDRTLEAMGHRLEPGAIARIRCVIGHFHFGLHRFFPGRFRYVTILRDPIDRVLSLYYHIRDRAEHPLHATLHELALTPEQVLTGALTLETSNDMTRRLAGAEGVADIGRKHYDLAIQHVEQHFVSVGLLERYDESMALFEELIPELGDLSYPAALNTKKQTMGPSVDSPAIRKLVAQRNAWDIQLYSYAAHRFDEQVAAMGSDWPDMMRAFEERCQAKRALRHRLGPLYRFAEKSRNKLRAEIRRRWFGLDS